jgi:hypothetical protein
MIPREYFGPVLVAHSDVVLVAGNRAIGAAPDTLT